MPAIFGGSVSSLMTNQYSIRRYADLHDTSNLNVSRRWQQNGNLQNRDANAQRGQSACCIFIVFNNVEHRYCDIRQMT